MLEGEVSEELRTPKQFEDAAKTVTPEHVRKAVRVSSDLEQHVDWLRGDLDAGFDTLMLHNVNRAQAPFVKAFGQHVLPTLLGKA